MKARVSVLLKSRASLTCFRAFLLPGRAKDLSAPRYTAECAECLSVLPRTDTERHSQISGSIPGTNSMRFKLTDIPLCNLAIYRA